MSLKNDKDNVNNLGNATKMQNIQDKLEVNNMAGQNPKPKSRAGMSYFGSVKTTKQGYDILHFNYKRTSNAPTM